MKYKGEEITSIEFLVIIAVFLLLIFCSLITYYIIINEIHSCTSSPLNYAASKALEKNVSYSYVELRIFRNSDDIVPLEIIKINLKSKINTNKNLSI